MKTRSLLLAVALGVSLAAFACGGSTAGIGAPVAEGEVQSQSGLTVSASIIAVTLGDDCPAAGAPALCAEPDDGSGSKEKPSGDAAPGGCGSPICQQSNVQLSFATTAGTGSAKIEIVSVTLHDASSGAVVDTLTAREPRAWTGTSYAAWDQTLKPSTETKASYYLTAPSWGTVGSSYSQKFKLRMTVRIDGQASITLESQILNREPAVAT